MSDDLLRTLFDEFRRGHEAGERPDPLDALDRAGGARHELAGVLDLYLADHPAPDPGPVELDALASDPRFATPTWPTLLVSAREERRLLLRTAGKRLTKALGFGPAEADRVGEHLHGLETGLLPPAAVSERVIEALDAVYEGIGAALRRTRAVVPAGPLESRTAFHRSPPAPRLRPAPMLALSDARDDSDPQLAEVDRLFLGS